METRNRILPLKLLSYYLLSNFLEFVHQTRRHWDDLNSFDYSWSNFKDKIEKQAFEFFGIEDEEGIRISKYGIKKALKKRIKRKFKKQSNIKTPSKRKYYTSEYSKNFYKPPS